MCFPLIARIVCVCESERACFFPSLVSHISCVCVWNCRGIKAQLRNYSLEFCIVYIQHSWDCSNWESICQRRRMRNLVSLRTKETEMWCQCCCFCYSNNEQVNCSFCNCLRILSASSSVTSCSRFYLPVWTGSRHPPSTPRLIRLSQRQNGPSLNQKTGRESK